MLVLVLQLLLEQVLLHHGHREWYLLTVGERDKLAKAIVLLQTLLVGLLLRCPCLLLLDGLRRQHIVSHIRLLALLLKSHSFAVLIASELVVVRPCLTVRRTTGLAIKCIYRGLAVLRVRARVASIHREAHGFYVGSQSGEKTRRRTSSFRFPFRYKFRYM